MYEVYLQNEVAITNNHFSINFMYIKKTMILKPDIPDFSYLAPFKNFGFRLTTKDIWSTYAVKELN